MNHTEKNNLKKYLKKSIKLTLEKLFSGRCFIIKIETSKIETTIAWLFILSIDIFCHNHKLKYIFQSTQAQNISGRKMLQINDN